MGDRVLKGNPHSGIAGLGEEALSLDLKKAGTRVIADAIQNLPAPNKSKLLSKLDLMLRRQSRKSEQERVAGAKLLVALLPGSLGHIKKWLSKKRDRWDYEFHFSLFCFLDDSIALSLEPKVLSRIEELIVQYLEAAKSDTAQAAWMAADLLGHHWPGRASLDALICLARQGRHVEGRKAALSGLQRRLDDQGQQPGELSEIVETLESVASSDVSLLLRRRAERILEKTRQSNPPTRPVH